MPLVRRVHTHMLSNTNLISCELGSTGRVCTKEREGGREGGRGGREKGRERGREGGEVNQGISLEGQFLTGL